MTSSITAIVLLVAGVVMVIAPALDRSKERTTAEERRSHVAFVRAERARLAADQRAQRARSAAVARLHATGRNAAARGALLADVRAHVDRDVRARVATGELDGPIGDIRCHYRDEQADVRVHLECLAVTSTLVRPKRQTVYLGHPFAVAASLRDGRYAWCKANPRPGEGSAGHGTSVPLAAACTR